MSTNWESSTPPRVDDPHRPWLRYYPDWVPSRLEYPTQPVWWLLDQAASRYPNRIACHYYHQVLTYGELLGQARNVASTLRGLCVEPGDRVGLLLPNVPEFLSAAYGIWMCGGIVVALNPLMASGEVAGLVSSTDCRTVIALDLLTPQIMECGSPPENVVLVSIKDRLPHIQRVAYQAARWQRLKWTRSGATNVISFPSSDEDSASIIMPVRQQKDDPAFILPTGGTTGDPKAVTLSHGNLVANAWQLRHWTQNRSGNESLLAVVPFFHSFGLTTCVTTGVAAATTMILYHRFKPKPVVNLIRKYRPTCFPAVPSMMYAMNESMRPMAMDEKCLDYCIAGGAKLEAAVADEFGSHTGAMIVEGYGLSEASPVTHVGPLNGAARNGSIGFPLPDTEARIVDAETGQRNLGPGCVGELQVRGPQVMLGYWNQPQATAAVIRDDWLVTGDLARIDELGHFQIVDRKKDLIITSGRNVYPDDVESVVRQFPGVTDAAVVGVHDPQRGEVVKVVLVVENRQEFDRKAFDEFMWQHLARYKCPRIVAFADGDLPRNFLGKILRRELR